ncbi:hypothetical protein AB0K20_30575 [Micromonospora matsumotoense]|uniref:hypothetical protein n=1 Tax=Micromonospora matsumotoense TaxID=121616 RepID=UPI00342BA20F
MEEVYSVAGESPCPGHFDKGRHLGVTEDMVGKGTVEVCVGAGVAGGCVLYACGYAGKTDAGAGLARTVADASRRTRQGSAVAGRRCPSEREFEGMAADFGEVGDAGLPGAVQVLPE